MISDPDFKVTTFFDFNISEPTQDRAIVTIELNRKSYVLYNMVTFPMTLTDPNPVFNVTAFLKSNISKTVHFRDKLTKEH